MRLAALTLYFLAAWAAPSGAQEGGRPVYFLSVEGIINPVAADYVDDGFRRAEADEARAVVVTLNTPGGLLDSTRDIIARFLNAPFPVVVYIAPRGARAASAGVFLTLASDAAAMAPETHLGAAHPVTMGGSPEPAKSTGTPSTSVMEEKVVSDAAAYARALAASKGRNARWAERAVRESVSLTAREAAEENVVELIAEDEAALLKALDGRSVTKGGRTLRLDLQGAPRKTFEMDALSRLLHAVTHPNIAYLLLVLGFYALIYEFASPGLGAGALIGLLSLLLAFYGLHVLPVNYVGMALVILGIALLAADLFMPSGGMLSAGGLFSLVGGSLLLFDRSMPAFRVSLEIILGILLATAGFFLVALRKALQSRRGPPLTGLESLLNEVGEVRPDGSAFLRGESWSADADRPLAAGDKVRVTGASGNRLKVEKLENPSPN